MSYHYELDTPSAYQPALEVVESQRIANEWELPRPDELTPSQRKLLAIEEAEIGLTARDYPHQFIADHNYRLAEFQDKARDMYDEILPGFQQALADHLRELAPEYGDWHAIIAQRLAQVRRVYTSDYLRSDELGAFRGMTNNLIVSNAWGLVGERGLRELKTAVIPHELTHAASVRGVTSPAIRLGDRQYALPSRMGIDINMPPGYEPVTAIDDLAHHAQMLGEAVTEDTRAEVSPSEDRSVGYIGSVAMLRVIGDIAPDVARDLRISAFAPTNLGATFGKLERVIGPFGIEAFEAISRQSIAAKPNNVLPVTIEAIKKTTSFSPEIQAAVIAALEQETSAIKPQSFYAALQEKYQEINRW